MLVSLLRWCLVLMMLFCCGTPALAAKKERLPISDPLVAVTPNAQTRVYLDVGMGGYGQGDAGHFSLAFAPSYEYGGKFFGFHFRLPFGWVSSAYSPFGSTAQGEEQSVSAPLLGDLGLRFRWRVMGLKKYHSYLSFGFEVTLPATLLNSLGGKRADIQARRFKNPVYQAGTRPENFNILPIRYLNIGPQIAFAQKVGPVTLGVHLLATMIIASQRANLYESPHIEAILTYDVYAVYNILGNRLIEAVLEFGGNSVLTTVATDLGSVDAGTGLTLTLGARSLFAKIFEAGVGVQIGIPVRDAYPNMEKRGYDLTTFYRHKWSLLFRFGVLL